MLAYLYTYPCTSRLITPVLSNMMLVIRKDLKLLFKDLYADGNTYYLNLAFKDSYLNTTFSGDCPTQFRSAN